MSDALEHLVQDVVEGTLWRTNDQLVLVMSPASLVLRGKVLASGQLWLRYAISYLGPRHLAVVPGVFVAENGGMLYGEQAWRFIFKNYQLYPRAEILGLRSDGDDVQVFMRELDLADTPRVLVYDDERKTLSLGQLSRIIQHGDVAIPERARTLVTVEREE
jgi:hypothetical protein